MKIYGKNKNQVINAFKKGDITLAVYGLGKMGLPLASIFADNGAKVIGVDISEKVVENINKEVNHIKEEPCLDELVSRNVKRGNLKATTDPVHAAENSDVMIILVPTLIKDNKPDLSPVHSAAENISKGLKKGDVVITECTMPPGSTESLIPILEKSGLKAGKDFGLAHCPERTMTGTAIRDIRGMYPKIIGALDNKTDECLKGIYSVINSLGVISLPSIKAAELVKVFEGVYRDVNIGLANELDDVCKRFNVDYTEVQQAANTQPYCHLHKPGGVGGHCIPFYPYFIMDENTKIVRTARDVNDSVPDKVVNMVRDAFRESGKEPGNSNILILGITFRGDVRETIKSTSIEIIEKIRDIPLNLYIYDPLFSKEEIENFEVGYSKDFRDMDCVLIASDHKEFRQYDWKQIADEMRTKILVDTRQIVNPEKIRSLGFTYRGIGYI